MPNAHISLPKSSLLRFSISGKLHYLDLNSNSIKSSNAASYNTKENYYPPDSEEYISKKVETKIGRIAKDLSKMNCNTEFVYNPEQLKGTVIEWITVQWLRTAKSSNAIKSQSMFGPFLPLDFFSILHNDDVDKYVQVGIKTITKALLGYDVNIAMIKKEYCDSTFILPTTHFVGINNSLFFILSPLASIVLIPKEYNAKTLEGDIKPFFSFKENNKVDELIPFFIRHETLYGNGHLIGDKEQLIKAQEIIKKTTKE